MVLVIRLFDDHIIYMCCKREGDFMRHVTTFKLFEFLLFLIPCYDIKSYQCVSLCEKGRSKIWWLALVMKQCFFQCTFYLNIYND
jgi:hypothetical protein